MTRQTRASTGRTAAPAAAPSRGRKALNAADRTVLESYRPLVQALGNLLGPHCEVVLHFLEDPRRSVDSIANGHVTGRTPGSPLTDLALDMLRDFRAGGPLHQTYYSTAPNGHPLKSSSAIIRNAEGKAIGMLCVNLDLDVPLHRFAQAFAPAPEPGLEHVPEYFAHNVADLLESTVDAVIREAENDPAVSASQRNKQIVCTLFDKGVFEFKEAIHYVAARLKVTHHTVYMHIRRRRKENGAGS